MALILQRTLVLSIFIGNVLPQSPCEDWEAYKDETCINIFNNPGLLGYDDASAYCALQTVSLMTIDTQEKQDFLENFLKSKRVSDNVWLGLKYSENNGYEWLDGTPFHFANWATGSPKNESNYCVEIHTEDEKYGKWSEVLCDRKNVILCEKLQLWSSSKVQKSLMNLMKNPVPMGFIYVQLPSEEQPGEIWPWLKWKDITSQYAGVRAEGGNSSPFGQVQEENSPRLIYAEYHWQLLNSFELSIDILSNNQLSKGIRTGVYIPEVNNTAETGIHFEESGGEVRPRNMAIRIWKRIQ